jgi:predicted RNA binding protein YcfA (HicA-like mRNA interferase family)
LSDIPAISGYQLIKLLCRDGWVPGRKATHGRCLTKKLPNGRTLVTFVPETTASLPEGTLHAILSSKQTQIGKAGLVRLLNKYGIK